MLRKEEILERTSNGLAAMKVLNTMLSEDAQNRIISDGQDLLSYSQDVNPVSYTHLDVYKRQLWHCGMI